MKNVNFKGINSKGLKFKRDMTLKKE